MTNLTALITTNQSKVDDDYIDAFSDVSPVDPFELKKIYLATQLAALMSYSGKTRSEMAEKLGWQKSRVTKVLSGHDNLTIKSICEFSTHLGYDFDVIFHSDEQPRPRPRQPWQIQEIEKSNLPIGSLQIINLPLQSQSPYEVFVDILSGNAKPNYLSFDTTMFGSSNTIDVATNALPAPMKIDSISTEIEIPVMQKKLWR